jgi:hypothetical protein
VCVGGAWKEMYFQFYNLKLREIKEETNTSQQIERKEEQEEINSFCS